MSLSLQRAVSNGTLTSLALSIDYFDRTEISVLIGGVVKPVGTGWNWVGTTDKTMTFSPAVANGVEVTVKRSTVLDTPRHEYTKGAQFVSETLDENFRQTLHAVQEAKEGSVLSEVFNDLDMHGFALKNIGTAVNPGDAVSLGQYQADAAGASASKVAAAASEAAALTSKNNAATSEANALTYKNNAATSATNAATSEGNALSSKNAAATSASNAATSEANALTSKNSAATSYTNFRNIYQGPLASAPTLRPDSTALQTGDTYFDTTLGYMRIRTAAAGWANANAANTYDTTTLDAKFTAEDARADKAPFRNRLINGDMRINQRGAGTTSIAANTVTFTVDRWKAFGTQGSKFSVGPNGSDLSKAIAGSLIVTTPASSYASLAADQFVLYQTIEGTMLADLMFGNASAQALNLSFRAFASVTGTYSGCLRIDTGGGTYRSFTFTYAITVASTWQNFSIPVPGDVTNAYSGANFGTTSGALDVMFNIGSGSSSLAAAGSWTTGNYQGVAGGVSLVGNASASWGLTAVQLEVGTVSTFERRPIANELALCQRYYAKTFSQGVTPQDNSAAGTSNALTIATNPTVNYNFAVWNFPVPMRVTPTAYSFYNTGTGTAGYARAPDGSVSQPAATAVGDRQMIVLLAAGSPSNTAAANIYYVHAAASAEL
jgi:hypothetical protein